MLVEVLDSEVLSAVLDVSHTRWAALVREASGFALAARSRAGDALPSAVNKESDDLLHKHTYYCSLVVPKTAARRVRGYFGRGVGYVFFSGLVEASFTRACELGGINLLLSAGQVSCSPAMP